MSYTFRRTQYLIIILICLLLAGSAVGPQSVQASHGNGLKIVRQGQANAVVIYADNADEQIQQAALTLVEYVQKSTGAVLPVMTETQMQSQGKNIKKFVKIYVGPGKSDPHLSALLEGMNSDGFVIHPHGHHLIITGPSSWGTMYGVLEFLERYVGVRWLMPGPDGEDVPQKSDIVVPKQDVKEEPAFASRVFSPLHTPVTPERPYPLQSEWAEKNRMHLQIEFHHNMAKLFPPSQYRESHPEFYPNGIVPDDNEEIGWQPCFTAPGIVEEAIGNIIQFFNDNPDKSSYSLGINDGNGFCEADPSHPAYPDKLNSVGLVDMSDIYYDWVNQVVEGVLEVYPDKWFGLLAYENVTDPPSGIQLNSRVVPLITKDRMAWIDEDIRDAGQAQMEAWSLVADNLGWYDYNYGAPYTLPRIYTGLMADNYRFARDHGVIAHYSELYPNWGEGPKAWISAKLQWNPDLDEEALLEEWAVRAVGAAAAPDLIAYYEHWEHFWTERIVQSPWFHTNKVLTYFYFDTASYLKLVTDEEIAESRSLLESVVDKTVTDQQEARANLLLRAFEYYEASALSYPKDVAPPADVESALAMLEDVVEHGEEKVEWANSRYDLVDEFKNDPVLIHQIDPRPFELRWSGWNPHSFWRLANYVKENEPTGGPVTDRLEEIIQNSESALLREYSNLLFASSEGLFPINDNPSFEYGTTEALSWIYWIRESGSMARTTELAHTGDASLVISDLDRGGPAEMMSVKPGLLAARAFYYTPPGSQTDGSIQFGFNLIDAEGAVLSAQKFDVEALKDTAGEWASIHQLIDIPDEINGKEVKKAQVVVIVNNLTDGTKLYIDDVEAYQAPEGWNFQNTFWSRVDLIKAVGAGSDEMRQELESFVQNAEASEEREYARLLLEIAEGSALPINDNDSFESVTDTVPPWAYWVQSVGSMQRDVEVSRTGQASLRINNLDRGGPFQSFLVSEGPFASRVHYYLEQGATNGGTVQLSLNLLDAQGNVLDTLRSGMRPIAARSGAWTSVDWIGSIPEAVDNVDVVQGQFVVVVDGLGDGNALYVDDAVFYQSQGGWDFPNTLWNRVEYLMQEGTGSESMQQGLEALALSSHPSEERDYASLLLSIVEGTASSKSVNDSFETGASTTPPWAYWVQYTGSMQRDTGMFHSGMAGLRIEDLDPGGPFQTFEVGSGAFASRVHYFLNTGSLSDGHLYLSLNLLDESDNVIGNIRSSESQLGANPGIWTSIDWAGIVPDQVNGVDVAKGQFVVVVDSLGAGNTLYLDDAVFYQNE